MDKTKFPIVTNFFLAFDLIRRARLQRKYFLQNVRPILVRFGLADDKHLKKYLGCKTWKAVYDDIVTQRADFLRFIEAECTFRNEDLWKPFRAISCETSLKPTDAGFEFAPLPDYYSDSEKCRKAILEALVVKDGDISIVEEPLNWAAIIHPNSQQEQLYFFLLNFCEKLEELNVEKRSLHQLLYSKNGKIAPRAAGVLGYNS